MFHQDPEYWKSYPDKIVDFIISFIAGIGLGLIVYGLSFLLEVAE
jgi:hypothetical protein